MILSVLHLTSKYKYKNYKYHYTALLALMNILYNFKIKDKDM